MTSLPVKSKLPHHEVDVTNPLSRKLLDQVRDAIRLKHYSLCTEDTYVESIKRYILFHNKRHPKDMGVAKVEAFLTHLAVVLNGPHR
jgi:hypothetical protein